MLRFFARCRDRDLNLGARPAAATRPTRAKQPDAAICDEMPHLARMENDPKSFLLCPYNVSTEPRRTLRPRRRLQLKLDVVLRYRIRAFPSLSSFPAFPNSPSEKGVDSDPMQRRILFPHREKEVQGLVSKLLRNKQL